MLGTILNQRFSLDKELGRGGMGAVYRATDLVLGRSVAIKVLKELTGEEVGRKIRLEAQILARLLHDYIVRLYDFGESEGTYYLVMEEVDGTSFQRRMKKLPLEERVRIASQVADALDYAHHQGVIHRDVKPANVLLTASDQAKLSDFGLSLLADEAQESGITKGTPHYMSPEQARGLRLDHRSDLYALGVILYECATGSSPFEGPPMAVMAQHINTLPQPPRSRNPQVAGPLEDLILALLAKDPAARPPSGRVVAESLRAWLAGDRAPQARPSAAVTTHLPSAAPTLARSLIEQVESDPLIMMPDERYVCGHYLAYLLGGSRRRGFLRRRPLDPLNADRARLLLGMASIMVAGATDESISAAAALLDRRPDVRPSLSPIVVMKYLSGRNTPARRKAFRQARQRLQQASTYARERMTDGRGVLNPGLMPQTLDDLRKVAPPRTEVDALLVQRWNRIAEAWRTSYEFRDSVLRYATRSAYADPASLGLWPEVVYPLIERARWQRRTRTPVEALWDAVCDNLHIPDAGVRLDHAIRAAVPEQVADELDVSLSEFVEEPQLDAEMGETMSAEAERPSLRIDLDARRFQELASDVAPNHRGLVRLASPDPVRLNLGELGALWKEAIAALRTPGTKSAHRPVPIGPYRLAVIPSVRGRSAGQVAIQGMPNHKQIEVLTPSLRGAGLASKQVLAVWVYQNHSLAIHYCDFRNVPRFIFWDAATNQQSNYDDAANLNHDLFNLGYEAPDQLDRALTSRFRPRNPA